MKHRIRLVWNIFVMTAAMETLAVALFTNVINPVESVTVNIFWQILLTALLCGVITLIYPYDVRNKKVQIIRIVLHYLAINGIVFGCGFWFGWYDIRNVVSVVIMAIMIAAIYGVITFASYQRNRRDAELMNARLKERDSKTKV